MGNKKYQVAQEAIDLPRRYYLKSAKKWVGIGGDITLSDNSVCKEATAAQYLEIGKTCPLVTLTTPVSSAAISQQVKS